MLRGINKRVKGSTVCLNIKSWLDMPCGQSPNMSSGTGIAARWYFCSQTPCQKGLRPMERAAPLSAGRTCQCIKPCMQLTPPNAVCGMRSGTESFRQCQQSCCKTLLQDSLFQVSPMKTQARSKPPWQDPAAASRAHSEGSLTHVALQLGTVLLLRPQSQSKLVCAHQMQATAARRPAWPRPRSSAARRVPQC